jgi:hypothetical protein
MTFRNLDEAHAHSLQTLNQLYEYDDFMGSIRTVADIGCGQGKDLEWWATRTTRDDLPEPLNIVCQGIDIIESCEKPVATICVGKAMSCGAVLLACGEKGHRYISKNATIMIHDVSSFSEGKSEEIKSDAAETERLQKQFYKMLDTKCERKDGYFDKLVFNKGRSNLYLDAEQCVKHGLVDEIKIPKFTVEIVHNIIFE